MIQDAHFNHCPGFPLGVFFRGWGSLNKMRKTRIKNGHKIFSFSDFKSDVRRIRTLKQEKLSRNFLGYFQGVRGSGLAESISRFFEVVFDDFRDRFQLKFGQNIFWASKFKRFFEDVFAFLEVI